MATARAGLQFEWFNLLQLPLHGDVQLHSLFTMAALDALSCGVDSAVDDMVGGACEDEHLPRTRRAVEEGIAAGLHFGAQVSVFKDGVEVGDLAVGRRGPDGGPMTSDAVLPWWSSVKPCLAVLAGLAVDRGHLRSLRDPVSRYVPEFAAGGKAAITIEDVLTHAAGLVCAGAAESHRGEPWDVVVAATCKAAPEWAPIGAKNGYQMGGAFHCVAEAVRRAWPGDRSYGELLRREVFEPLGARGCFCGVPFEMAGCGEMPAAGGGAFAGTFELSGGSAVDDGSRSLRALLSEDPAGAGRGPARGLAALYRRLLLDARDGDVPGRLLEAATARRMGETVHPSTFDVVQGLELDVGRAMYARPNFGGPYASPASFGHGGSRSSFGFGDPAVGLAVGVIFDGRPDADAHRDRCRSVMAALYEDLGLT